jgi:hypothetical protein
VVRRPTYALSLKQPWAALVAGGRKVMEIRTWATTVRGRVYIHAAKGTDDRPEAWVHVPDELRPLSLLSGGIIGSADLVACIMYRTATGFETDAVKHLNRPEWFTPPKMYGFEFRNPAAVPFVPCKGNTRFFTIELPESE